jgi:alpha-1,2-glucosyltransferase
MEAIQALRQALPWGDVLTSLANAWGMSHYLARSAKEQPNLTSKSSWASFGVGAIVPLGFFALSLASRSWLALVNKYVPEPYLVRQAPLFSDPNKAPNSRIG